MVYKKRYRKRYKAKAPLSHRQVKAISKIANKQIHKNSECKVITGSLSGAFVDSVGGMYGPSSQSVPMPAQGNASNQRIGDEIMLKSVSLRGFIDCKQVDNNHVRIVVVQDLQNNATALAHTDVFETSGTGDEGLVSFYKVNPTRKFKVLSDLMYEWDSNNASAPKEWNVSLSYKDLKYKKIQVNASGTVGDIRIFVFGGEGSTGPAVTEMMRYRVRFYDN